MKIASLSKTVYMTCNKKASTNGLLLSSCTCILFLRHDHYALWGTSSAFFIIRFFSTKKPMSKATKVSTQEMG